MLDWLFTGQLMIDEEWSTPTPRGFCWWADMRKGDRFIY